MTSAKKVSALPALSVNPCWLCCSSCCCDCSGATLRLNPSFIPTIFTEETTDIYDLVCCIVHPMEGTGMWHVKCWPAVQNTQHPSEKLFAYFGRLRSWKCSVQNNALHEGCVSTSPTPMGRQKEAIPLCPPTQHAVSPRWVFSGVSIEDICSTLCLFLWFYFLGRSGLLLGLCSLQWHRTSEGKRLCLCVSAFITLDPLICG